MVVDLWGSSKPENQNQEYPEALGRLCSQQAVADQYFWRFALLGTAASKLGPTVGHPVSPMTICLLGPTALRVLVRASLNVARAESMWDPCQYFISSSLGHMYLQ